MLRFLSICLIATLSSFSGLSRVDAGGYPPFGAWAYGSGHHVYRGRHVGFHHSRPLGWYGSSWHARYRWATPHYAYRVRAHHYRAHHYRAHHYWGRHHYVARYRYRVAPYIYLPTIHYVAPVQVYHRPSVVHYQPVCGVSTSVSLPAATYPSTIGVSTSLRSGIAGPIAANKPANASMLVRGQNGRAPVVVSSEDSTRRLVSLVSEEISRTTPQSVDYGLPDELLEAADAIFKAGGYRNAAQAYAQLSVRFGSSPPLLARRFVAQVLIRELDQAEVILQLCELSDCELLASDLATGGLSEFVGSPLVVEASSEALAARALTRSNDPLALRSVAQWLELLQDRERAAMFRLAAKKLENATGNEKEEVRSEMVVFD